MKTKKNTRLVAWGFFEWATQPFPIVVRSFIFAAYFTTQIATDPITGTYQWANAAALAGLIVAFTSTFFGAIADSAGYCKRWMIFFTITLIISSGLLWFVQPSSSYINFTLACVVIGNISFEMGHVFYNSYLPRLAPKGMVGRLSGIGFGAGFFGGVLALLVVLFAFIKTPPAWLDTHTAEQIRICGPFVALWIAVFTLPFVFLIPDTESKNLGIRRAISSGFNEMIKTLKALPKDRNLFLYIMSHMVYTDGMITLFSFAGVYAAGTFHFTMVELLYYGIAINTSVAVGAIIFAWVDDFLGSKPTVLIGLTSITLLGFPMVLTESTRIYWLTSLAIAMFVGPVQAASRSLMTKLDMPIEKATEMFGLYTLSGKITAFVGPWILGVVSLFFHNQRPGMATIFVFLFAGAWILLYVKVKEK